MKKKLLVWLFASFITPILLSLLFVLSANLLHAGQLYQLVSSPFDLCIVILLPLFFFSLVVLRVNKSFKEVNRKRDAADIRKEIKKLSGQLVVWSTFFFLLFSFFLSYRMFDKQTETIFTFLICLGVVMTAYSPFYFGILVQVHHYLYRNGFSAYKDLNTWSRSTAISVLFALSGTFMTTTLFVYTISKTFGTAITLYDVFQRALIVSVIVGVPLTMLILMIRRFYFQQLKQKQHQLRSFHELSEKLYGTLEITDEFLRDIVLTVKKVIGAQYAALALFTEEKKIERFIPVGWDGAPGIHYPEGKGLLGYLRHEKKPMRTSSISNHPASAGFPEGHPAMESFLGVPIIVNDVIIGSFYLTEKTGALRFTKEDEEMVVDFSRSLAIAIQNCRYVEELKEERKAAQEAAALKSQILSTMSHELRTPLNAIIGYSDIVIDVLKGSVPEKQMTNIERIKESGKHLLALINDILDLSKMESGYMKTNCQMVSLRSLLQFCIHNASGLIENKPVALRVIGNDDVWLFSDEQKLKQIIMNLLSNAIKFTEKGEVTIHILDRADSLLLRIQDTGIGISLENQLLIFEPFKQIDGSLSRRYNGTGLGLPIVQRLVHLLGGTIRIESEIGEGSSFIVELPIAIETAGVLAKNEDREGA
jgi:signal transduction histidine kinase